MDMRNLVSVILLVVLFSTPVLSFEDFQAHGSAQEITVCQCTLGTENILVQNTGQLIQDVQGFQNGQQVLIQQSVPSVYSVTVSGDAAAFTTTTPGTFALQSGEIGYINHAISAACGTTGQYDLETTITTETGVAKAISQTVNVAQCVNLDAQTVSTEMSSCPCEPTDYVFNITNIGAFIEDYSFSLTSDLPDLNVSFSEDEITLNPGESQEVTVTVSGDCAAYGDFVHSLQIEAFYNELVGTIELEHEVNACYDYSFEGGRLADVPSVDTNVTPVFQAGGPEYQICEREEHVLPLRLENDAAIENTYSLEMRLPDFVTLDKERTLWDKFFGRWRYSTTLAENEVEDLSILLAPPVGLHGEFVVSYILTSAIGDISEEGEFTVEIQNCFEPSVVFPQKITVNASENYVPFGITNTGSLETTYTLSIEGPEFLSVPGSLTVEPGQEELVNLGSIPSGAHKAGTYDFTVTVTPENGVPYTADGKLKLERPISAVWYIVIASILLALLVVLGILAWRKKRKESDTGRSEKLAELADAMDSKSQRERAKELREEEKRKKKEAKLQEKEAKLAAKAAKKAAKEESLEELSVPPALDEPVLFTTPLWKKILFIIGILIIAAVLLGAVALYWYDQTDILKKFWGIAAGVVLIIIVLLALLGGKKKSSSDGTLPPALNEQPEMTEKERIKSEKLAEKERIKAEKAAAKEAKRLEKEESKRKLAEEKEKAKHLKNLEKERDQLRKEVEKLKTGVPVKSAAVKPSKTEKKVEEKSEPLESKPFDASKKIWIITIIAILALLLIGGVLGVTFLGLRYTLAWLALNWPFIVGGIIIVLLIVRLVTRKKKVSSESDKELKASTTDSSKLTAQPLSGAALKEAQIEGMSAKEAAKEAKRIEKEKARAEKAAAKEKIKAEKEAKRLEKEEAKKKAAEEKAAKLKAEEEAKKKAERDAYLKSDEYHTKVTKRWYITLILVFLAILAGLYFAGPFVPQPDGSNFEESQLTDTLPEGSYDTDEVLQSIENGRYARNDEGHVIDTKTLRVLPRYEYLKLLRDNEATIVEQTELDESGFDLLLKTLDKEYQERQRELLGASCDITVDFQEDYTIDLTAIEDPDGDELSFEAFSSDHILFTIDDTNAIISPELGFSGVEIVSLVVNDGKGGEIAQNFNVCVQPGEEDPDAQRLTIINWFKDMRSHSAFFLYAGIGLAAVIFVFLIVRFAKPVMDFLTEEDIDTSKQTAPKDEEKKENKEPVAEKKPRKKAAKKVTKKAESKETPSEESAE